MRRPLSGALLGILIGIALAIVLQRQGVWPLDQLTLFLLPAVTGLLGLLLLSIGRKGSMTTLVIALIILIPMAVWGALGFGKINEQGQLNGGCEVFATSSMDLTEVTDTSRMDPFEIDPDGSLTWGATSPTAFQDYDWEIHVVIGGAAVPLDSDTEANDGGSQGNTGDVSNIREYAAERGIDVDLLTGVYEVGGFAATCDGFGFVVLTTDGFDTIAMIALIIAIILLLILLILMFRGRRSSSGSASSGVDAGGAGDTSSQSEDGGTGEPGLAADITAAALSSGFSGLEQPGELGAAEWDKEDADEITKALDDIDDANDGRGGQTNN